ncbi:MAG: amidohydrolase family protein, partial [Patescibacteria group bacterium]
MKTITGQIIDVENEKIFPGEISIKDGDIKEIKKTKSAPKVYIMPGLCDAHIHIESSMLVPSRFAQIAVSHGTVATVSDPHEVANVLGIDGINYMVADGKWAPFKFFWTVPSCVPATEFETSGARLDAKEVEKLLKRPNFIGLSEVMNYPGVINNDSEVMAKIAAAKKLGKPIDGHAPMVTGRDLKKYVAAGITTDHESLSAEEAEEKIKLGMKIWVREGSAARNLDDLLPVIKKYPDRCGLCSDDLHPDDLVKGHINLLVKRLLAAGMDLFTVLRLANYNIVKHYNLKVGLLREGDAADFIVVDDLDNFNIWQTWINGEMVAIKGKAKFKPQPKKIKNNFHAQPVDVKKIAIVGAGFKLAQTSDITVPVINAIDHQLITRSSREKLPVDNNGHICP